MKIFISHSSKDKQIVDGFIDLLNELNIELDDIFCSSAAGTGIKSGTEWRNAIKEGLQEATFIFLIISSNYKESEICQNEMGAAWMIENARVIPLIIEPITYSSVGPLEEVNQLENIAKEESLERIKDILLDGREPIRSDRWNYKMKSFITDVQSTCEQSKFVDESEDNFKKLRRGGYTPFIVDATLSYNEEISNMSLNRKLISDLQRSVNIDLKFNYLGSLCANNWKKLSGDPRYAHYKLSDNIKTVLPDIVEACRLSRSSKLDFISLGPGDGQIDQFFLNSFQDSCVLENYYPLDISFELLQEATATILQSSWLNKSFKIKPIHGDFTELVNYMPVYGYNDNRNFFSLLGFTFGDFNEGELIGKIKEGMQVDDYLLLDVRLHDLTLDGKLTKEDKETLRVNYNHSANNRFAFGPLESVTVADYNAMTFELDVSTDITVIEDAVNIITACKDINTRFRLDNKPLRRNKINLASTTLYCFEKLEPWFEKRQFHVVWKTKNKMIGLFLLQKIA